MESFNRNDKQHKFASIKGKIIELNNGEKFCSITLEAGHENKRPVNLVVKKINFDKVNSDFKLGDRVVVKFYLTSRVNGGRWVTMANVLEVLLEED